MQEISWDLCVRRARQAHRIATHVRSAQNPVHHVQTRFSNLQSSVCEIYIHLHSLNVNGLIVLADSDLTAYGDVFAV